MENLESYGICYFNSQVWNLSEDDGKEKQSAIYFNN